MDVPSSSSADALPVWHYVCMWVSVCAFVCVRESVECVCVWRPRSMDAPSSSSADVLPVWHLCVHDGVCVQERERKREKVCMWVSVCSCVFACVFVCVCDVLPVRDYVRT